MKTKTVAVIYMDFHTTEHKKTLVEVESVLKNHDINYSAWNRDKLPEIDFKNIDLTIVVGGDGTFLRTSHFVSDTLMFGVNSDDSKKEGFFMQSNRNTFSSNFDKILSGKFKSGKLARLKAKLNSKELSDLALNEFYIGSKTPYQMSRYNLKIDGVSEDQKSSGILIGTPCGSHAWIKSAGGDVINEDFLYLVREPYNGKLMKHSLIKGEFSEKIVIRSNMSNGIVVIDSLSKEYSFCQGDVLEISKGMPLNYVEFESE